MAVQPSWQPYRALVLAGVLASAIFIAAISAKKHFEAAFFYLFQHRPAGKGRVNTRRLIMLPDYI